MKVKKALFSIATILFNSYNTVLFSIATILFNSYNTRTFFNSNNPFPGLLHFILDTYQIMLSVKHVSSTIFIIHIYYHINNEQKIKFGMKIY